jgi:hypothetical protein
MKKLMFNSVVLIALLLSSCGKSDDNSGGGKIISIRDQIGETDSLGDGSSAEPASKEEDIDVSNMSPVEQVKVMIGAVESKNNDLVNTFINFDSLDSNGSLDYFDYVLFSSNIPSEYSANKKAYMKRNSHKIMPSYLKSEFIKVNPQNKGKAIDRVIVLKNSTGEFSISANSYGSNNFQLSVNQENPDGIGGGSFSYRFHIGPDKKISLVQIMPFGGSISF